MPTSAEARRRARTERARAEFGPRAQAALDALALLDFAWHDCYAEPAPPEQVVEDVWTVASGNLAELIPAVNLAVIDFRDLRVWADRRRPGVPDRPD